MLRSLHQISRRLKHDSMRYAFNATIRTLNVRHT